MGNQYDSKLKGLEDELGALKREVQISIAKKESDSIVLKHILILGIIAIGGGMIGIGLAYNIVIVGTFGGVMLVFGIWLSEDIIKILRHSVTEDAKQINVTPFTIQSLMR